MEKLKTSLIITLLLATALMIAPIYAVKASETFFWGANVLSSGETVTSPVLESGKVYRIEAQEIFWYDYANNLAADAMYYTTDPTNHWNWLNHFPAPGGHSFLQINGLDVNWGPFSNGDTYHTYSITYIGQGMPITFQIVDWIDRNYANNNCHLPVWIYLVEGEGCTPGYWKNHPSAWPADYSTSDPLSMYFDGAAPPGTLLEALRFKGGPRVEGAKQILARAATAALLNAAAFSDYPYTVEQLMDLVSDQFSYGTRETILHLAAMLDDYNNLGCSCS